MKRSHATFISLAGLIIVVAVMAGSHYSEAIDLLRFPIAWLGVLVFLDGLVLRKHGRSPLATPADWLWSLGASVAFWDLFELVNLRLQDWWYTGEARSPIEGAIFGAASFATVLPAVRLCQALVSPELLPAAPSAAARDRAAKHWLNKSGPLAALGIVSFALAMVYPTICFPLAWLFVWPLAEAALVDLGPREDGAMASPLESWREGDRKPLLRLLLCGIPLGLVWEGLNWGCARGWVYTVPHFESHKLFEMPLLGFIGYPPFLLEAGAILALTDRIRRAIAKRAAARVFAPALLCLAVIGVHLVCDTLAREHTAISFASKISDAESIQPIASFLEQKLQIRTPRDLLDAAARSTDLRKLALDAGLRDSDQNSLLYALQECALAERTAMGLGWAETMVRVDIDSLKSLAQADSDSLFEKLTRRRQADHLSPPNAMLLRLWIARARRAFR